MKLTRYMYQQFLKEIEMGSKNALIKKRIITYYIYNGSSTIPDLSKELDLSVPTVTKLIGEMYDEGYINDYGKLETALDRLTLFLTRNRCADFLSMRLSSKRRNFPHLSITIINPISLYSKPKGATSSPLR